MSIVELSSEFNTKTYEGRCAAIVDALSRVADGGTIMLDDIGQMELAIRKKNELCPAKKIVLKPAF